MQFGGRKLEKVRPVSTPKGLGPEGKAYFRRVARDIAGQGFTPTQQEIEWLRAAAALEDVITALRAEWERLGRPMVERGSGGGTIVHPLLPEIRQTQHSQALTLARIRIPEEPAEKPIGGQTFSASEFARRGAQARWAKP